jgi:hypothetical protein
MAPSTSTATAEQIAVPETLLKKRRQNDKTREEKLQKATEARKVSLPAAMKRAVATRHWERMRRWEAVGEGMDGMEGWMGLGCHLGDTAKVG